MRNQRRGLDTVYESIVFRSKVEAMWAVFFDQLNIQFEYEYKKFNLENNLGYIPDFWLPKQGIWIEIKNGRITEKEKKKITALYNREHKNIYVFNGFPLLGTFVNPLNYSGYIQEIMGFNILLSNENYKCETFVAQSLSITMMYILKILERNMDEIDFLDKSLSLCRAAKVARQQFSNPKFVKNIIIENAAQNYDGFIEKRNIEYVLESTLKHNFNL